MLTKRGREIWQGLVTYANSSKIDLENLRKTIYLCMPYAARGGIFDVFYLDEGISPSRAAEYQSPIRKLLVSLCDREKELPKEELRFLRMHARHVRLSIGYVAFDPNDPERFADSGRVWYPNGEPKRSPLGTSGRSKEYQDIADPICDFILDELERIKEDGEQIPLVCCKNPRCTNLIMPKRIGMKAHCSDDCKSARHRNELSQIERNDYQWLYRRYTLVRLDKPKKEWKEGALKQNLKKNHSTFERIKLEHARVPRIQNLIAKLEKYAR
jgi:hypothetical protein